MTGLLKRLFGIGPKVDFGALIQGGAVIVDVRTPGEYAGGHIKGSVNMPLATIKQQMASLKKDKPVITCCASGMRSSAARAILLANEFGEVYNAGSWHSLRKYGQ